MRKSNEAVSGTEANRTSKHLGDVYTATKEEASHHEAGHAIVADLLGWHVSGSRISRRFHEWWGDTDADPAVPNWKEHLTVLLGGGAGEALFTAAPDFPTGCLYEWNQAVELAGRNLNDKPEVELVVSQHWNRARALVSEHEQSWRRFAAELLRSERLSASRCSEFLH